jgi:hypothetical protein
VKTLKSWSCSVFWNCALPPADGRKELIAELIAKTVPADGAGDFKEIIERLVERKLKYFADNRRFILDHHWTMTRSGPHLSVISTMG